MGRKKGALTKGEPKGMADFTGGTAPEPHLLTADTADFLKEASVLLEVGEGQGTASPGEMLAEYQIAIPNRVT